MNVKKPLQTLQRMTIIQRIQHLYCFSGGPVSIPGTPRASKYCREGTLPLAQSHKQDSDLWSQHVPPRNDLETLSGVCTTFPNLELAHLLRILFLQKLTLLTLTNCFYFHRNIHYKILSFCFVHFPVMFSIPKLNCYF